MAVIKIGPNEIGREIRARNRQTPAIVKRALVRSARRGRALLVRRTPKDLGQAKAGWRVSVPISGSKRAAVDLYNDTPYVGILEMGARPHRVSLEGRVAIQEWVRRNIPPVPVSGPVRAPKFKTGGRRAMQAKSSEAQVMAITEGIIWKLRTKGQEPTYFVKKSIPELQEFFVKEVDAAISKASKRRANRKGGGK